jgi:hypothetical protein
MFCVLIFVSLLPTKLSTDLHVHGYLGVNFNNEQCDVALHARAKPFGSYCLLIGSFHGANAFGIEFGIILKDSDSLTMPLILETIPSAGKLERLMCCFSI